MSETTAISVDGLTRRYGDRTALNDVSFELEVGKTLVVFGANGAGKSTLLRVLATLLRPHAGAVTVLGQQLPQQAWAARGRIGLVTHEPLLYRELTARQNLDFCARLHNLSTARVSELLASTGLADRADEPVVQYSKGMMQRLAIARALIADPELLLLDEPRANLDPGAGELLEPLIGRVAGRTRVIVTHDIGFGLAEADTALGLLDGCVEFCEPAAAIDADAVQELYK